MAGGPTPVGDEFFLVASIGILAETLGVLAPVEPVEGGQPIDVAALEPGIFVLPAAGGLEIAAVRIDTVNSPGVFRAVSDAELGIRRRDCVL